MSDDAKAAPRARSSGSGERPAPPPPAAPEASAPTDADPRQRNPREAGTNGDLCGALRRQAAGGAALWREGRRAEALAAWGAAAPSRDFDPKPLLQRAERMLAEGEPALALRDLSRVRAARPRSARAVRGLALARRALGDFDEALRHWRDLAEIGPFRLLDLRRMTADACAAGDREAAMAALRAWAPERQKLAERCAYVALPTAALLGDGAAAAAARDALETRFGVAEALAAADAFDALGDDAGRLDALSPARRRKGRTPEGAIALWRAQCATGRQAEARRAIERLDADFDPADAALARAEAPRQCLEVWRRVAAVEAAFDALLGPGAPTRAFAPLLRETHPEPLAAAAARLDRLTRRGGAAPDGAPALRTRLSAAGLGAADPSEAAPAAISAEPELAFAGPAGRALSPGRVEHLAFAARAEDAARLARGPFRRARWGDFVEARARLNQTLDLALGPLGARPDGPASAEPDRVGAPFVLAGVFAEHAIARGRARIDVTLSDPCWADAARLAAWFAERIARRVPTAWLRLDADARPFLPAAPRFTAFAPLDRHAAWRRWTGEALAAGGSADRPDPAAAEWIAAARAALAAGLRAADLLGAPPAPDLAIAARRPDRAQWRGAAAAIAALDAMGPARLAEIALSSDAAERDLETWDLWREALRGAGPVTVIGPAAASERLPERLAGRLGLGLADRHVLPASARCAQLDAADCSAPEAAVAERGDLPKAVAAVEAELAARPDRIPGRVHLVSAGPLTGRLLAQIKSLGGLALDVGDAPTRWLDDAGAAPTAVGAETAHAVENAPFRAPRSSPARPAAARPAPAAPVRVAVLGGAEIDWAAVAPELASAGLRLGLGAPDRDGVAGWRWAADPNACAPDATLALVRAPRAALLALLLDNADVDAFARRRDTLRRETGVDLGARPDPLQRAALSLLLGAEIVARRGPIATLRAERLAADLAAAAPALERRVPGLLGATPQAPGARIQGAESLAGPVAEAAAARAARPRQGRWIAAEALAALVAPEAIGALPGAILDPLQAFARRHGYAGETLSTTP